MLEGLQFYFNSSLFKVEPDEDKRTNPGRYGKQLAMWIAQKLQGRGYDIEVFPEDWGWCVMCARKPFMLFINCGNIDDARFPENPPPIPIEPIVWSCYVTAEVPIWKRIFKKPDMSSATAKLTDELRSILTAEPTVQFVDEP